MTSKVFLVATAGVTVLMFLTRLGRAFRRLDKMVSMMGSLLLRRLADILVKPPALIPPGVLVRGFVFEVD